MFQAAGKYLQRGRPDRIFYGWRLVGTSMVTLALLTAIRGDYFGRKSFATILGITQLPMNALWMTAPIIAGYLFDTTGSYTAPFLGVAALNFLAAALILAARKPALPSSRSRGDASAQIKAGPAGRITGQMEV